MTVAAFTAGPWNVVVAGGRGEDLHLGVVGADGTKIALLSSRAACDADLIATAFDYHAAATGIVNQHDADARQLNFPRCNCPVCVALRPLIEKAEGR